MDSSWKNIFRFVKNGSIRATGAFVFLTAVRGNFWVLCHDEFCLDVQAKLPHFCWLLFCARQTAVLLLQQTCCFYTCQLSTVCVNARLVCMCFPQTVFPCLLAQLMWVCILQCLAVGGWFESVSQREIVFRLCLLFPIRGQYANSRCQPSCCVLVWCLRCMSLAANHTILPPLLYPAGISGAGNPATSQLQQSGSLDRVRSDKIPLRWIFSATEDRRSRGYEHAMSKMVIWEVICNNNT